MTNPAPLASAKDKATDAAAAGKQAAGDVAQSAASAAKDVASETSAQAKDLFGQARSQVKEQASTQQSAIVDSLHSLDEQLTAMTDNVEPEGTAVDLVSQARDHVRTAASWLEDREPNEVLDELRTVGREHPGRFLLGALVAGVVAGRLTRGVAAVHAEAPAASPTSPTSPTTPAVTPAAPTPALSSRHSADEVTDTPSFGRPMADHNDGTLAGLQSGTTTP
jgi:inorganic triphosphatase YgiF